MNPSEEPVWSVEYTTVHNPTSDKHGRKHRLHREWLFVALALVLVVSIPLGIACQTLVTPSYLSYEDVTDFTGVTCTITDRFDQPIYQDGAVTNYALYGNLIGYRDHIHNSLLFAYSKKLAPNALNPFVGHAALETAPRVMKTTLLSAESQQELATLFGGKAGCCFSYNYETGEIYTALSLPAYDPAATNPTYFNRCLSSVYIPGSTMKIVTSALAIDQGMDMSRITYTCTGKVKLAEGKEIKCTGVHGKIDFSTAIGKSCNCYFAQLIAELDLEKALDSLADLGFAVNGEEALDKPVDNLSRKTSATNITNTSSFKNVWGLIGQGHTQVNAVDMVQIAAAIVNNGKAATPHLVTSIINPNKKNQMIHSAKTATIKLLSPKTADKTAAFWKEGVDAYYYSRQGMSPLIDYAKTGTAEQGDGTEDRLLLGAIESAKTAFFIVVEDTSSGSAPMAIANKLAQLLPTGK